MLLSSALHSSLPSFPPLYPCSPSHPSFRPFQDSPISPRAPVDAGGSHRAEPDPAQLCCAFPDLLSVSPIKIETERRVLHLGLSPFFTYLPWLSSTQNQALLEPCAMSGPPQLNFSTDNALIKKISSKRFFNSFMKDILSYQRNPKKSVLCQRKPKGFKTRQN